MLKDEIAAMRREVCACPSDYRLRLILADALADMGEENASVLQRGLARSALLFQDILTDTQREDFRNWLVSIECIHVPALIEVWLDREYMLILYSAVIPQQRWESASYVSHREWFALGHRRLDDVLAWAMQEGEL